MDSEARRKFDEDGFVILKNFLDSDLVERLRKGADSILTEKLKSQVARGNLESTFEDETFEKRLIRVHDANPSCVPLMLRAELHQAEAFFDLFCNPALLDIVNQLLPGAEDIRIFPNYSCRPKLPNYLPHEVVWHQDAGLSADGRPNTAPVAERLAAFGPGCTVNAWTPLVEATPTTGCMKAIPGSHKLGIQVHKTSRRYRQQEEEHSYGTYAATIDPDVMIKHKSRAVHLACFPGDVILFSNVLFHRGGENTSDIVRWSVDWRYQNAACPTHRDETGHVVWCRTNQGRVVKSAAQWTQLTLT